MDNKRLLVGTFSVGHNQYYLDLACQLGNSFNIDHFSLTESDINLDNRTINGRFWDSNKSEFVNKNVNFQDIDILDHLPNTGLKVPSLVVLRNEVICTPQNYFKNKVTTNLLLEKAGCGDYLIETFNLRDIEYIDAILAKYHTIILKPYNDGGGKGIFSLKKEGFVDYLLTQGNGNEQKKISKAEYLKLAQELCEKDYIFQPLINFQTNDGSPCDCRLHMNKGKNGNWNFIAMCLRVGSKTGVVANVSQGGYFITGLHSLHLGGFINFFRENLQKSNAEQIINDIMALAQDVAKKLQKVCKYEIGQLGFDIGFDRNSDKLYVIEISGFPAVAMFAVPDLLYKKFEYWHYLVENRDKILAKQRRFYERRYPTTAEILSQYPPTTTRKETT
ncbi:MAG: YheC/YheD family protein [Defluviitaleaceae bacterium]|nr:YheC/YheD family protein [Defluviitaleaceae bacterium]